MRKSVSAWFMVVLINPHLCACIVRVMVLIVCVSVCLPTVFIKNCGSYVLQYHCGSSLQCHAGTSLCMDGTTGCIKVGNKLSIPMLYKHLPNSCYCQKTLLATGWIHEGYKLYCHFASCVAKQCFISEGSVYRITVFGQVA